MKKYDTLDAYWHDIHDIPLLNEDEERKLAVSIKSGDDNALNRLVISNLRFVVSIARQYSQKTDDVSIDDLISEGNIALIAAEKKWNPDNGSRFISYASHGVKHAIQQAIPQTDRMITLDAPIHPGQTNTRGDMIKAGRPMTDDGAENVDNSSSTVIALRYLNDREKHIIRHYYGIGTDETMTMTEIASEMGLKRERVRQIRKTAERKMRRIMRNLKK